MRKIFLISTVAHGLTLIAVASAMVVVLLHKPDRSSAPTANEGGRFSEELARCKAQGPEAITDAACQEAWAEQRRRFLSDTSSRDR